MNYEPILLWLVFKRTVNPLEAICLVPSDVYVIYPVFRDAPRGH